MAHLHISPLTHSKAHEHTPSKSTQHNTIPLTCTCNLMDILYTHTHTTSSMAYTHNPSDTQRHTDTTIVIRAHGHSITLVHTTTLIQNNDTPCSQTFLLAHHCHTHTIPISHKHMDTHHLTHGHQHTAPNSMLTPPTHRHTVALTHKTPEHPMIAH